ncbi:MAG: peptide chain release factor 1 [Chlamydiia bacterium]|nr:peptide chain release factor 1 [Chlamydiia bacterium]
MVKSIQEKLRRLPEVEAALAHPDAFQNQKKYRELSEEHSYLSELKKLSDEVETLKKQIADNRKAIKEESDPEFLALLQDDLALMEARLPKAEKELEILLIPPDPNDNRPAILEIRAGTGGDEAALFVGDLVRTYRMYADRMGWRLELLSSTEAERGGFKEYVMVLSGPNAWRFLRHEGGTHRVQRVPETESQGRIHTSAVTVAALMEPDESVEVPIDEKDLRIDTYRASGAGGQHVNTTDSAVRITHEPTGIVVYSQEERSQHKNKEKALRLLKARIVEVEEEKKMKELSSARQIQVGSGDRSERIRTYNFPQNRVTDHRINLTKYNLDSVLNGELEDFTEALVAWHHQRHEDNT